jgi:hypothetical protein
MVVLDIAVSDRNLFLITNHPPLENVFPTFSTAYFHVSVLRSRSQHPASRDTNTSLYVVLRPRLRPPWMAEVSKM